MSGACDLHVRCLRKQSIGNSWDNLSHEWLGTIKNSIIFGSHVVPFYTTYIYTHFSLFWSRDTHLRVERILINSLTSHHCDTFERRLTQLQTSPSIKCCEWIDCWETLEKRIFSHWGLKVQLGLVAGSRS